MQQVSDLGGTTVPSYGNWTLVANLSNFYVAKINLNIPAQTLPTFYNGAYYSSNGSKVSIFTALTLSVPTPQTQLGAHVANFIEEYYPVFGAIMVWLMVFVIYGRQNISGIIESSVTRPTTKRKLFLARYMSTALLLFFSFIPLLLISLGFSFYFGFSLTLGSFSILFEGIFLSTMAFAGIEFIIYNLSKTEVQAFVTSIFLVVILTIFWYQVIIALEGPLGIGSGINARVAYTGGLNYLLLMHYINPLGFISLSSYAVSGGNFLIPLSWSPYAPTILTILAGGLIWTVAGFVISHILAKHGN